MIKSIQSIIWGSNVVKIWINNRKVPAYLTTTGILWVLIDRSADNYYQTITVEARCETYFISLNFKQNFNRYWASPSGSLVKNSPAKQEMWIQSLGQERPLEKEMATHSSILAGKFHGPRSLAGYSLWGQRAGPNLATKQQQWVYPTNKLKEAREHILIHFMFPVPKTNLGFSNIRCLLLQWLLTVDWLLTLILLLICRLV